MKRRAFLAGMSGGGLDLCGTALAGRKNAHGSLRSVPERDDRHTIPVKGAAIPSAATLSDFTYQQIYRLISIAPHHARQDRIVHISQAMKGTPYLAQPLIGSATTPEELVLSWRGVNCMTFVEIVLAASASHTVEQFIQALVSIRYRHHRVLFAERRHFFSDWLHGDPVLCTDLTPRFSYARSVEKQLNFKQSPPPHSDTERSRQILPAPAGNKRNSLHEGNAHALPSASSHHATPDAVNPVLPSLESPPLLPSPETSSAQETHGFHAVPIPPDRYLPGLPVRRRQINYLPTAAFLKDFGSGRGSHARRLIQDGDVLGIYSPLLGLDVFHIGLAVWSGGDLLFRNASSLPRHRYVVDTALGPYLSGRRGVVVYEVA